MKKLSYLACLLACLLAFSGCDKEQVPVDCDTSRSNSRNSKKAIICYNGKLKKINAHSLCHFIDKGAVQLIDNDEDGYVTEANDCDIPVDCDDTNPDLTDVCIVDADDDGFNSDVDCDDNNADINPNAAEILGNNVDENCDGLTEKITLLIEDFNDDEVSYTTNLPEIATVGFYWTATGYVTRGVPADFPQDNLVSYNNMDGALFVVVNADDADEWIEDEPFEGYLNFIMDISNVDISGYSNIQVCLKLAESTDLHDPDYPDPIPDSWNYKTSTIVSYDLDATGLAFGIGAETVVEGRYGPPLIDTDGDGVGDGPEITSTLTEYCFDVPEGNILDLQIVFTEFEAATADVGIDDIIITGYK